MALKAACRKFLHIDNLCRSKEKDFYISTVSRKAPWVYSSYIVAPLYYKDTKSSLVSHQNQQEAIAMVEIWNQLGYNVCVQNYLSSRRLPKLRNVYFVFGLEPLFCKACKKYHPKYRFYYSTGCYCDHQTHQVKLMTDIFNSRYHAHIPYRRAVTHHNSNEESDKILMIGSDYTIQTLPKECRKKVVKIRQSTQSYRFLPTVSFSTENDFLCMASAGNILRGIPLLIEYFSSHGKYKLHLIGPIESDVMSALRNVITPNIIFHGTMDINSDEFLSICAKCNFIIYPSGSEGCPGSVLNAMKSGLIPIVSRWAAFDGIDEYGYLMTTWDVDGIDSGIQWAESLSKEDICLLKKKCSEFVRNNFSLDNFINDFSSFFRNIL